MSGKSLRTIKTRIQLTAKWLGMSEQEFQDGLKKAFRKPTSSTGKRRSSGGLIKWFTGETEWPNEDGIASLHEYITALAGRQGKSLPLEVLTGEFVHFIRFLDLDVTEVLPSLDSETRQLLEWAVSPHGREGERQTAEDPETLEFFRRHDGVFYCYRMSSTGFQVIRDVLVIGPLVSGRLRCRYFHHKGTGSSGQPIVRGDRCILPLVATGREREVQHVLVFKQHLASDAEDIEPGACNFYGLQSSFASDGSPASRRIVLSLADDLSPGMPEELLRAATRRLDRADPDYIKHFECIRNDRPGRGAGDTLFTTTEFFVAHGYKLGITWNNDIDFGSRTIEDWFNHVTPLGSNNHQSQL